VEVCDGVDIAGMAQNGAIAPMFIAAYKGHKKCIETLARLGGNVNVKAAVAVSVSGVVQAAMRANGALCSA